MELDLAFEMSGAKEKNWPAAWDPIVKAMKLHHKSPRKEGGSYMVKNWVMVYS
jgi:hypothetical protein